MAKHIIGIALFALGLSAAEGPGLAPTCSLVPGWAQHGAARTYTSDNLYEYMDGNAEGYLLYGFQTMRGVTCTKAGVSLVVDISDFGDSDSAYGMYTANRDDRLSYAKIGAGGQIVPRKALFTKGQYYAEVAANEEGDHTVTLQQWTAALEKVIPGTNALPATLAWFPTAGQQSIRLIPESVLGIRLLKRGYAAQYDSGKAFLVIEASPESAAALMPNLQARFAGAVAAKVGDGAFQATDRYLGHLCFFRKGRYVGGYANVPDGKDPVALATAFAAKLP